jgi:hypothetical protein
LRRITFARWRLRRIRLGGGNGENGAALRVGAAHLLAAQ